MLSLTRKLSSTPFVRSVPSAAGSGSSSKLKFSAKVNSDTSGYDPTVTPLQDHFLPTGICYGCGSANENGFQIKSTLEAATGDIVMTFTPSSELQGWPGILYGGTICSLFDCHANWASMWGLYQHRLSLAGPGEHVPFPTCVTGKLDVSFKAPTPIKTLKIRARAVEVGKRKVIVDAELEVDDKVTATARGIYVSVVRDSHIEAVASDNPHTATPSNSPKAKL